MVLKRFALVVALASFWGVMGYASQAQDTGSQPVTLAYKFEKGVSITTKMVAHVLDPSGQSQVTLSSTAQRMVKEVKPDGSVVLAVTPGMTTIDFGSGPQPGPAQPPFTITFDKFGRFIAMDRGKNDDMGGGVVPEALGLLEASIHVVLPDHPVKSGDTWQTLMDDPLVKDKKAQMKNTFDGTIVYHGQSCWKVEQSLQAPIDADGNMLTVKTVAYLDPKDGTAVYTKQEVRNIPTISYGLINWDSEMTIVTDANKSGGQSSGSSSKP